MSVVWLLVAASYNGGAEPAPARPSLTPLPAISDTALQPLDPSVREQIRNSVREAQAHPLDSAANGRLGMLLQAYELYTFAAPCYDRARRLDTRAFAWPYYLATLRMTSGEDPPSAIVLLRETLRVNPNYFPARLKLAEALLATGAVRESRTLVDALLQAAPRSARLHYLSGRVREAMGDLGAAADEYRQASNIAPQYGSAHYALALAHRRLGHAAESQQQMELFRSTQNAAPPEEDELLEAIEALKTGVYDHLNRAQSLQDSGRNEEAVQEYETALRLNPRLLRAHVNLIVIFGSQGNFAPAAQHFEAAIAINPNSAEAYYNYGLVLSSDQKFQDAEQAFRKAIDINPVSADAYNNLGFALQSQNKIAEAEASYRSALHTEPALRQANFNLARLLEARGDLREAISCLLKTVIVEDDKTSVFMYYLSDAYAQNKEFERAIRYGKEALSRAIAFHQTELAATLEKRTEELSQLAAEK